jgi:hypothetical protein
MGMRRGNATLVGGQTPSDAASAGLAAARGSRASARPGLRAGTVAAWPLRTLAGRGAATSVAAQPETRVRNAARRRCGGDRRRVASRRPAAPGGRPRIVGATSTTGRRAVSRHYVSLISLSLIYLSLIYLSLIYLALIHLSVINRVCAAGATATEDRAHVHGNS